MSRSVWKGHISFGLVMIPVTLYSLEKAGAEVKFHLLDSRDERRVKYQRVNEATGKEVPWSSIVKGYETAESEYVVLTPEDFKRAAPKATRTAEIVGFVDRNEVSPKYFEKPYVLEPGAGGEKSYALLREALAKSDRMGIAKVVMHTRQYMAAVMAEDQAILLITMRFDDELRAPSEFDLPPGGNGAKTASKELAMANTLIEGMTEAWNPSEFKDEYQQTLRKWIAQRSKSGGKKQPALVDEEDEQTDGPYNLMEMLKRSVEGAGATKRGAKPRVSTARRKAG